MSRIKVEEEKEISIASLVDNGEEVKPKVSFSRKQLLVILVLGLIIGFLVGALIYG